MYCKARMRIHQQKQTLAKPCLFYVFKTYYYGKPF